MRIPVRALDDYWEVLSNKTYRFAKPDKPEQQPWGDLEMTISDPFSNQLTFFEADN